MKGMIVVRAAATVGLFVRSQTHPSQTSREEEGKLILYRRRESHDVLSRLAKGIAVELTDQGGKGRKLSWKK